MATLHPSEAIYPKKYFRNVIVLHDGTPNNEISIAEIQLADGRKFFGIRQNENLWNDSEPNKGFPLTRGLPSWFLLSDLKSAIRLLTEIENNQAAN